MAATKARIVRCLSLSSSGMTLNRIPVAARLRVMTHFRAEAQPFVEPFPHQTRCCNSDGILSAKSCASGYVPHRPLHSVNRSTVRCHGFSTMSSTDPANPPPPRIETPLLLELPSDLQSPSNPSQPLSFLSRLNDKYSISKQQSRIQLAERLFQAASRQAANP
jgi:hypothetical protein